MGANIIDRQDAEKLFVNPKEAAQKLVSLPSIIEAKLRTWRAEFEEAWWSHEVVKRWPHAVYPPLPPDGE